jgi:hypothetical protein
MPDLDATLETLRIVLNGGSWDEIRQSPGLPGLFVSSSMFILPSLIGVATGIAHWRETPLAQKLGFRDDHNSDWVERACDLDRDGRPDF